jgi:hypothetical protein
MENDPLAAMAFLVLLAVAVFFCLYLGIYFTRWVFEEWRLAGPRAVARMTERLARERERRLYHERLLDLEEESRLAALGERLIMQISGGLFQKAKAVFGQLRAVRTGLDNFASVCFHTLHYYAASYEGLTSSPWELADLAPERHQAKIQVVAIATAGHRAIDEVNKDVLFDSSLVAWKLNLHKIRQEICPNCPVVSAPANFPGGCPVMLMTCEVKTDDEKEPIRQQP